MKKIVFFAVFMSSLMFVCAQNAKPSNNNAKSSNVELLKEIQELRKELQMSDSITRVNLKNIADNIDNPRFKMYQTENIYNLLKLDTRTGRVWQVQYRMGDTSSGESPINYFNVKDEDYSWNGRFELYPTQNVYTFIMLDTYNGFAYQVQWNANPDKRFVERIY